MTTATVTTVTKIILKALFVIILLTVTDAEIK